MTDDQPMPASAKAALAIERLLQQKSQLPDGFDFRCLGPGCGQTIRKPRYLKFDSGKGDRRRGTWSWCSQACLDAYVGQFHLPGPRWPKYDQDGNLVGYVVPKRHFVSVEEIDAAGGEA